MITRYRKRYRKMGRWIHRGAVVLATILFLVLAGLVVAVLALAIDGEVRNPVPVFALLAASFVTPFIVAGIFESILSRLLHWRFRRYLPRMFRASTGVGG